MTYPEPVVNEHRGRVEAAGASPLTSKDDVDHALTDDCVVIVNSVCGCAANMLIPALEATLTDADITAYQVFAGVDDEATSAARNRFGEYGPSSPSVAVLKDAEVCSYLPRRDILSKDQAAVEDLLDEAFDNVR